MYEQWLCLMFNLSPICWFDKQMYLKYFLSYLSFKAIRFSISRILFTFLEIEWCYICSRLVAIWIIWSDDDYADELQVETVEGLKELHIPSGIQPGDTVKLQNMGVPKTNERFRRGDHIFIVDIQIPKRIRSGAFVILSFLSFPAVENLILVIEQIWRRHGQMKKGNFILKSLV